MCDVRGEGKPNKRRLAESTAAHRRRPSPPARQIHRLSHGLHTTVQCIPGKTKVRVALTDSDVFRRLFVSRSASKCSSGKMGECGRGCAALASTPPQASSKEFHLFRVQTVLPCDNLNFGSLLGLADSRVANGHDDEGDSDNRGGVTCATALPIDSADIHAQASLTYISSISGAEFLFRQYLISRYIQITVHFRRSFGV